MKRSKTRTEQDSMGAVEVPVETYYGASTQRAVENFPISGERPARRLIRALGRIKAEAARVNGSLGELDPERAEAIFRAALEVSTGVLDDHFVVDLFQTGSGTSWNMNANEVIASRAAELLGQPRGSREAVHPNDHVNRGQSSNDVIPTAIHLAALIAIREVLDPALERLLSELRAKADSLWPVMKTGRTHLQDAAPIRLGQVFLGFAGQIERGQRRIAAARAELGEVALGGTAVGTGLNTHPDFARRVCARIAKAEGVEIRETDNHFQAQATLDAVVAASGHLRTLALATLKIANDIRWLASGPRAGLGELRLPEVQPGSSIMPGKVNPVIAESSIQVAAQVLANDQAIVQAGEWGFFELNTMLPLAGQRIVGSIEILGASARNLAEKCVAGLEATERGPELVRRSLALATRLVPLVGYDAAAAIAKEAAARGETVREVAARRPELAAEDLDEILDPSKMA